MVVASTKKATKGEAGRVPVALASTGCDIKEAKQRLKRCYFPPIIPCRDVQRAVIRESLLTCLDATRHGALLIHGPTGTGKTSCVFSVIREMLAEKVGGIFDKWFNISKSHSTSLSSTLRTVHNHLLSIRYFSRPFLMPID